MEYAGEGRSGGRGGEGAKGVGGNGDTCGNGGGGSEPERAVRVGGGVSECCGEEGP